MKEKEHTFLSTFIFFCFIIDDFGGHLGIRNIAFFLMGIIIFIEIFGRNILMNEKYLIFYLGSTVCLLLSVMIAISNGAQFLTANRFNFNLYFFIILYILARRNYLTIDGYLWAIKFFVILILVLFFGRIFNVTLIKNLFKIFSPAIMGEFKNGLPSVYFKGILEILPATIFFAKRKNIGWALLCLIALGVAPSRFGVFVCILFFLIINIKKIYIPIIIGMIFFICINIFKIKVPVLIDFYQIFVFESSGNSVRFGHLKSIMDLFGENPLYLVFGQGPGSSFYTSGFHAYTDLVEISHFDIMRRYGILYFSALNSGLFFLLYKLYKTKREIAKQLMLAIIAHYIVAISNPVLLSLPFMMLISISISLLLSEKAYKKQYV